MRYALFLHSFIQAFFFHLSPSYIVIPTILFHAVFFAVYLLQNKVICPSTSVGGINYIATTMI